MDWGKAAIAVVALAFMAVLAAINLRGVSESVKLNVGLTIIEITGLLLVILVGLWAFTQGGDHDFSRVVVFESGGERSTFVAITAATSLAFFAMVGFEDSVNMAEETKDPVRIFPKVLLTGLTIAGVVYVLPPVLGAVHKTRHTPWVAIVFTTLIAFGLILYVSAFASSRALSVLGGTTSLLLLAVFAMVNIAVLVLRRDVRRGGGHFKTPTALPVIGCVASLYLVMPLFGRPGTQYLLAGILLAIGIVLFGVTMLINRQLGIRSTGITDPTHLANAPD